MVTRPDHISDKKWRTLTDDERAVESDANELLASREFISHDTGLIRACFEHSVMSRMDIINYPQPQDWSVEQCKTWCQEHGYDFRSEVEEYDRAAIEVSLMDVIQFGMNEIETDCLRRILLSRLDNSADHGLRLWREVVGNIAPEIYEWWGIEEDLADDLIDFGQRVLKNEYGKWWGRGCTGQHILMDGTLQAVIRRRRRVASERPGQPNDVHPSPPPARG